MQYTGLGNSGLIVSRLAFGVMTFGSGTGPLAHVWKTGQEEANRLVGHALDAGINFFDTADSYAGGESEIMLGKALGTRRKDIILSTKIGFRTGPVLTQVGGSFRYILNSAERCLKRLNTDAIDLLSVHKIDPWTPLEETARALENLVQRGLVRYVGYSNFTAWQSAKFLGIQQRMGYAPLVAAQMYYSLVGRDLEREVVPFCQDAGIGIVVWSPLASGFLSGRYTRQDPAGGKGRIANFDFIPFDKVKGYDLIDVMRAIASRHQATVAQVALAWLLAKPFVSAILLGASKLSQLEDNLGAAEVKLSAQEVEELDKLTAPSPVYPNWFQAATLDSAVRDALGDLSKG
ncbi:MAG TPA: aldo/keto reductase [Terriglobales bacterium]|nr:aldo/keto reductase [Terriglobales bacterium]